ncbi:hypothetical protein BJY01DRAFT_246452 [Aspergillus pseudoustus]|uniref:DUF7702 domain-containing protein n=1 Tax=Aspergillus pseudoustus TaxID=1810923 RepID=A0ABR4K8G0_9EURO
MNGHQILAILELVLYATLLPPVLFCTFHYLFKKQFAWLYLQAFVIAKIAGPAIYLSIAEKSNASRSLQMAAQILYSIALGPLLSATLSFVNTNPATPDRTAKDAYDRENLGNDHTVPTAYLPGPNQQQAYTPLTPIAPENRPLGSRNASSSNNSKVAIFLRLLHPVIIIALVLGIMSGTNRSPSSDGSIDADKYDRGATFAKASSALFLVALFGITPGVVYLFRRRQTMQTVARYMITAMPVIIPLLFLRILYSVLGAANLDTTGHAGHTKRYNVLTGSWAVYLVLGLIPQGVVLVAYTVCGVGAWWRERGRTGY